MTAPEHLTISGPEDILGYIPHSLGYWPSQSLVAMTMQGKRLGATLRVDLPEGRGRRGREAFARTVAEYLLADKEADGTLLVFFTDGLNDDGRESATAWSFRPLLADLECALGLAGMPVRDAWRVGDEYWRNVYCTDSSCCPPPGRPIAEIRDSRLNAEMVYLGSSVGAPPGDALPGNANTPAAEDAAVTAAERDWTLALAGKGTHRAQFDAVLDAWTAALEAVSPEAVPGGAVPGGAGLLAARPLSGVSGRGLEPELAGFLRASLRVPAWRDAVLVMAAAGRAAAAAGAEAFGIFSAGAGSPVSCPPLPEPHLSPSGLAGPASDAREASAVPGTEQGGDRSEQGTATRCPGQAPVSSSGRNALPGYGEVLLGLSPPVPDWDTLKRLEGLMVELSCGGGEAQAAALTATGWIEWCRGRGSFAHASLTRALEASPGYRLAELLSEVVRRGTICGWAGRREAAWQKFGADAA
ncbi:DUF4192 family protein [Arthrobacter sp. ISL-65]|uniref:DUF4192 family protein n=1 Tax=Arthrobacter sp. ISL-65 TaxID=2819112 RepID=UPI001BECD223|nr:DUF4192 family protein [Arthrobacter sp. ISL-65]MBT2549407.1 DUF4192 domain-containing protein [Arthrobacter sp. ISL-65]